MIYTVTDIEYDVDGYDIDEIANLPKTLKINVPDDLNLKDYEIIDYLGDEISNITDFCHKGFSITKVKK